MLATLSSNLLFDLSARAWAEFALAAEQEIDDRENDLQIQLQHAIHSHGFQVLQKPVYRSFRDALEKFTVKSSTQRRLDGVLEGHAQVSRVCVRNCAGKSFMKLSNGFQLLLQLSHMRTSR